MTLDQAVTALSIPAWLLCLVCLLPAVWRLLRWRGRYTDPILALVSVLVLNRLSFLLHISLLFSHASALVLALVMAGFAVRYQRRDAAR